MHHPATYAAGSLVTFDHSYCRTFVGAGKGGGDEASDTGGTAISGVAVAAGVGTLIGPAVAGTAGVLTGTGSSLGTGRLTRAEVSVDVGKTGFAASATGVPAVRLFMLDMFGVSVAAGVAGGVSVAGTGVGGARLLGVAGGDGGVIGLVCEVGVASATAVGAVVLGAG